MATATDRHHWQMKSARSCYEVFFPVSAAFTGGRCAGIEIVQNIIKVLKWLLQGNHRPALGSLGRVISTLAVRM